MDTWVYHTFSTGMHVKTPNKRNRYSGMQQIKNRYYLDEMIDAEGALFAAGVVPKIYFTNNGTNESNDSSSVQGMLSTWEKFL